MGKKDDMTANPPGPDEEDDIDAADTGGDDKSNPLNEAAGEEDPNLAGLSAQLRGLYKGLLDEPIPDRFMSLLKELEDKEADTK